MSKKIHDETLSFAHPLVRDWFLEYIGTPTEPQIQGWPAILAGKNTLISAPTGSGKTLAAFLIYIDQLVRRALSGELNQITEIIYISPLKALSNDVQKNLLQPLAQIAELAEKRNLKLAPIDVAVRTGDTLMRERQAMLRRPPHILITTPESLYILLTAEKSREILRSVKTVIVDEIHAIADDKRGAHLALSLERLAALTVSWPMRIGLSATQKPLERVAKFLVGNERPLAEMINIGHARHLDIAIEVPASELSAITSHEMWEEIYVRIAELVQQHRSTLVFVNTRRLAERVAHHLAEKLGEDAVAAHHGSLSRKLRLAAETKLKNGELKVLVATASLELGIDIGSIDLVCQIGSPRAISVALQRVGRAGHWHGAISKGRIFATTRNELLECAALIYAIKTGDLDQLIIPKKPIDILAQQIVATCSTGDWKSDDLFKLVTGAFPYAELTRETFNSIINILADGIAGSRGRYGAYLFYDRVNGIIKARRGSRLTAIMNGGAIPETGLFTVVALPDEAMIGTLDEDFAIESNRGDIILLGNTSWQIQRVESRSGQVLVEDAHGAPPSVPFWLGEAPARTNELSLQVSQLRNKLNDMLPLDKSGNVACNVSNNAEVAQQWLQNNCGIDYAAAEQLIEYILAGRAVLGTVPTQTTVIAERFFDESGGMQLVIHAPFGARINKAWGFALRKKFCRSFNFELQAAATDDGLNISLAEQHSFPLSDVFHYLHPNTLKETLVQAVLQSPLFTTRWRWVATRSLALTRFRHGKKIPPNIQRMLADDLLAAVFPDAAACQDNLGGRDIELPEHPLIVETMKDALEEALDLDGLQAVLTGIYSGSIQTLAVDTPVPSPFSHEILNANPYAFLDDAPLEERRARAVELRRVLPDSILEEVGKLDPEAITEVQREAWPDIRSADDLHDVLQTCIALPEKIDLSNRHNTWQSYFDQLVNEHRATVATYQNKKFWVAAEKVKTFSTIYPQAQLQNHLKELENETPEFETALVNMLRGWICHLGPTSGQEISDVLALEISALDIAFIQLETSGMILRGQFTCRDVACNVSNQIEENNTNSLEWCERRLLARIHRLTLGKLRKEIEPVTAEQFMQWLLRWQHVASGTQLSGEQGLLEIIKQLQGFELPANAWEPQVFAKRIKDYDSGILDRLCFSGMVSWGRLSPLSAAQNNIDNTLKKNINPTSVAPITFFLREEMTWISTPLHANEVLNNLTAIAKQIHQYLLKRGASFFADIVQGLGHLKTEVERGLWELVAAGVVTADSFDNLRGLINPKRRLYKGRHRLHSFSAGRWSLLSTENHDPIKQMEAMCWNLLNRYGVVFRDLLAREKNLPRWRELLKILRRLEERGEIRGGRFVSGFVGEQFALPYAMDSLRAAKKQPLQCEDITIAAVDPLNLIGIITPGDRVAAVSKKTVTV